MQMSTKYLLACLMVVIVLFRTSSAAPGCGCVISVDPKDCRYGVIEYCGKNICAKGSGARCSLRRSSPFRCGDGYFCGLCGHCQGCSLHILNDCFNETTICSRW